MADTAGKAEGKVKNLLKLTEIGNELNSTLDLDALLKKIMNSAQEICEAEASSVLLLDEKSNELYFKVALGEKTSGLTNLRVPVGVGVAGWVAENRKPLSIPGDGDENKIFKEADTKTGFKTKSILCVPVILDSQLTGVLQVLNKKESEKFSEDDLEYLNTMSNQAAIAIRNSRLIHDLRNFFVNTIELLMMSITSLNYAGSKEHLVRVAEISTQMASQLLLSRKEYENIYYASLIHDIGILAASDSDWMSEEMYVHAKRGADLIGNINMFSDLVPLIRYHHEYFDGSGYYHLRGEDIPFGARIISLAEGWQDYKELCEAKMDFDPEKDLKAFLKSSEHKFDPEMVKVLKKIIRET